MWVFYAIIAMCVFGVLVIRHNIKNPPISVSYETEDVIVKRGVWRDV